MAQRQYLASSAPMQSLRTLALICARSIDPTPGLPLGFDVLARKEQFTTPYSERRGAKDCIKMNWGEICRRIRKFSHLIESADVQSCSFIHLPFDLISDAAYTERCTLVRVIRLTSSFYRQPTPSSTLPRGVPGNRVYGSTLARLVPSPCPIQAIYLHTMSLSSRIGPGNRSLGEVLGRSNL